jgi:hypothetical protein
MSLSGISALIYVYFLQFLVGLVMIFCMLALQIDQETAGQPQVNLDAQLAQRQNLAFEAWDSYALIF